MPPYIELCPCNDRLLHNDTQCVQQLACRSSVFQRIAVSALGNSQLQFFSFLLCQIGIPMPGYASVGYCQAFCGWHDYLTLNGKKYVFLFTANAGKQVRTIP